MTDLSELLPCPFCGGIAHAESFVIEAAVRCQDCGVTISRKHAQLEDTGYPEAITAWNRRASPQPAGVRVSIGEGWETHTMEDKQWLQKDTGIPNLPTDMTYEARMAVSGEGPRAYEWSDKKHRLVYDLCREIERLAALEPQQEEAVAWVPVNPQTGQYSLSEVVSHFRQDWADDLKADGWTVCPLYAHPTPVQKVQESQTVSVTDEMVRDAAFVLAGLQGFKIVDEVDQRMFEADARRILDAALGEGLAPAEPAWNEFTETHRKHFPMPDGTEVEVSGYDTQYQQSFAKVMRVRSQQWNGYAPYIAWWRLPPVAGLEQSHAQ